MRVTIAAETRISRPVVLLRPLIAETLGTGLLVATVVGSGVMAQKLAPGQVLLQLLCNALATVAVLGLLIALLASASGAHFNPAVTLAAAVTGVSRWSTALGYLVAQFVGGCLGTVLVHAMFSQPLVQWTGQARGGVGQLLGEVVPPPGCCW